MTAKYKFFAAATLLFVLQSAMPFGEARAQDQLETGKAALERGDFATALNALEPLAESGNAPAQTFLGRMHLDGRGVPQNYLKALGLFRQAADQGDADAHAFIGIMYLSGLGVRTDLAESLKWYRQAAELGHEIVQMQLGDIYRLGEGVPKDPVAAAKWYRMAAKQGQVYSQVRLGNLNMDGIDGPPDYVEAAKWYRLAADQDNAFAQKNLGDLYKNGRGVRQNYPQAMNLYRSAIEGDEDFARNNLAWLLATAPDPSLRNGIEAVRLAQHSIAKRYSNAIFFDTLAAAFAEIGWFDEAVQAQEEALESNRNSGSPRKAEVFELRLAHYRAKKPWREDDTQNGVYTVSQEIELRAAPAIAASRLGTLDESTEVLVDGLAINRTWAEVITPDQERGYIPFELLRKVP